MSVPRMRLQLAVVQNPGKSHPVDGLSELLYRAKLWFSYSKVDCGKRDLFLRNWVVYTRQVCIELCKATECVPFGPKVDGDLWRSRDSKGQASTIAKVAIWRFFGRRFVFGTKNLKTIQNIKWKPVIALNVYYVPVFFNPWRINGRTLTVNCNEKHASSELLN